MASRERTVRGRHTPAGVAVVHDVVVDQRGRLEELHGGGHADEGVGVGLAGGAVAPVEEGGPQPLAAGEQAGDGAEQLLRVGAHLGEDLGLVGEDVVDGALHALTQGGGVERAGHHAFLPGVRRSEECLILCWH